MNDIIFRVIVPDNKILFKTLMLKGERGLQGTSIVSIEKTQTIGLTDYYTITLNDGTTYEFTVQNGTNSYFDDELSLASENAVQNKVITAAINAINAALVSIQQYDNALSLSSENAVQNKVVAAAIDSINSALALLAQYDSALSDSSENAVQNKVVKAALDLKANLTALNNYYNKTEIDAAFNNLGASGVSYNNASSGLSATDTQSAIDEIDNALSGKENTLTTTTGTITASSNVTLIRPKAIKWGKVKTLTCVFMVTGSTSTLGTIPSGFEPTNTIDFSVNGDSGHGCRLQIVAGNNTIAIASAPTQNEYYAFTVTYI